MISMTGTGSQASSLFRQIDAEIPPGPPDGEKLQAIAHRNGLRMFID